MSLLILKLAFYEKFDTKKKKENRRLTNGQLGLGNIFTQATCHVLYHVIGYNHLYLNYFQPIEKRDPVPRIHVAASLTC